MTLAVTNKLSLHLWSPPIYVHSRLKNISTVPTRPRPRPAIRSPLAGWMWVDYKKQTWVLTMVKFTVKANEWWSTHASLSTGPHSPHSSPQQWNLHNSLSIDQTSTELRLWLMRPPDPPAEPPSCERTCLSSAFHLYILLLNPKH